MGQTCSKCGHVAFPAQTYGCEVCGAYGDAVSTTLLEASGELQSYAQVTKHRGKPDAPFTIGEIRLDSGPYVRGLMTDTNSVDIQIGEKVVGVLIPTSDQDDAKSELRFASNKGQQND